MFRKCFISLLTAALCVGAAGCASNDKSTTEAVNAGTEAVKGSSDAEEKTADAGNESSEASNDSGASGGTQDITKVAVGAERMSFYEEMAKKYEEANAGKKVELIEIVSGSDMYTKITMMMQSPQTCPNLITEDGFIPLFLFASKTSPEETSMRTFQMLYSGTGAQVYDNEANKWIVDKENLLKVFEFINQVYNVDKVGPPLSIASQQKVGDLFQSDYMCHA